MSDSREDEENLVLFADDDGIDDKLTAFDEMNIVETPFALLTRDTAGKNEISLSADGRTRLVCADSTKYGLPNSLAPRAILALMWMWKKGNGERSFQVRVRELVTKYMFPNRFTHYEPGRAILQAVERQLNCVANTRIHTDTWFDKNLGRQTEMNAAIIDYVQVIDPGGRNRPRVLEIGWGEKFLQSMNARYTKPLDPALLMRLEKPIDVQLYRVLDRQLSTKRRQRYASIVHFARRKLAMHGATLDAGGRTASSYVARKLSASLLRLHNEGFSVRMTIDKSTDAFAVLFERLDAERPNEVCEQDSAGDLIRLFHFHAHGVPTTENRRISKRDRDRAAQWLQTYGVEQARWMVARCVQLQQEAGREPIRMFVGLEFYEAAAAGAYAQSSLEQAGQQRIDWDRQLDTLYKQYEKVLLERFHAQAQAQEREDIEARARKMARDNSRGLRSVSEAVLGPMTEAARETLQLRRMKAMESEEFRAHRDLQALHAGLRTRHGFDPLQESI